VGATAVGVVVGRGRAGRGRGGPPDFLVLDL